MAVPLAENRREIALQIFADIQAGLLELNPFFAENLISAIGAAFASGSYDNQVKIRLLEQEFFPQTTQDIVFLDRWGDIGRNVSRKAASSSSGLVPVEGVAGTIIPQNTIFQFNADPIIEYQSLDDDYTITEQKLNVASLTADGTQVFAELDFIHEYSINMTVVIAGASPSEFNGTFIITAIPTETSFVYSLTTTPATATGSITVTTTYANVRIESTTTGASTRLENGAKITLKDAISNVSSNSYVPFAGIGGGADQESFEKYRTRVLEAFRNPRAFYNNADIKETILSISGITRAWVFDITPEVGDVTSYFTRDNDNTPIPTTSEITEVKNELEKIRPATTSPAFVYVKAPTAKNINFVFTNLEPDSITLRDAIKLSLKEFFKEQPNVSENLTEDAYRSSILRTINPVTGEFVRSFVLSEPIGDISVADGELPLLGTITFNVVS
jgi:uncharacterized phage protein gp47/JayE